MQVMSITQSTSSSVMRLAADSRRTPSPSRPARYRRTNWALRAGGFAGALGFVPAAALAAPYASAVSETGGTVSFTLNEDGANVTIFRDGSAQPFGSGLVKGLYTFARDGAAEYSIQVSKAAAPGYAVISTASTNTNFELPRGVAVNNNPAAGGAPNPLFGRTYVSNGRSSPTAAGRTLNDGIYLLNPDLTSAVGQGDVGRTAGISMATDPTTPSSSIKTGSDPFKLAVGPDNRLYISHFSNTNAGLFDTDADVTRHNVTFDASSRDATTGLNATSGSVSDVLVVGAGAARTLYTTDEDVNSARLGIQRYNIGTAPTFAGAPAIQFNDPNNLFQNNFQSLAIDDEGNFWVSQNRAGGSDTLPSLVKLDSAGNVLFNSLTLSSTGNSLNDPLRTTQAIAYDPVNDVIAAVGARNAATANSGSGVINIVDADTGAVLSTFFFALTAATTNTDVAFDAAGNLYATNRSAERLLVFSPGNDSVATTFSDGRFTVSVVPEPAVAGLAGMAGLAALGRRRRARA